MAEILLTGATGFVGRHVAAQLRSADRPLRCAVRSEERASQLDPGISRVRVGALGPTTDWSAALDGVGTVLHLAARAHILDERAADPLAAFLEVNTEGTLQLARSAARAGVRRFVFLSSVKVNGESSGAAAYSANDIPAPMDPYGVSKLRAEEGLRQIARDHDMEVVIIRSPLVYGPGVRANFLRLMKFVDRGVPLPLASIRNERSLVSVWNLGDLLTTCIDAGAAANRTFMVSDGEDLSTAGLVRKLAMALGRKPRLLPFPPVLLQLAARASGQMAEYTRLCASLKVDLRATRETLGWRPPLSVDEALALTAGWYRAQT